jgi:hypothetical protein
MFETLESAEVHFPPVFGNSGERFWSYVKLRLHIPWFYVSYRFPIEEDETLCHMALLTRVEHLVQLAQDPGAEIGEIDIMLPGHMSGKDNWTMEPLTEVWQGTEPGTKDQPGYVFVTGSGAHYVESALNTPETDLRDKALVFSVPAKKT